MTAITTDEALDVYEAHCPHVLGNPYIPHFPHPKQALLLGAHLRHDYDEEPIYECLFGGAAGGGKSDAILMAAAQYAWRYPHFRGLCLRQTHTELALAGALMERAQSWWLGAGVGWDGHNKIFRFPNGATVQMGYHSHPTHNKRYQGGEWHFVAFDELTHWPDKNALEWLSTRIRKTDDDPIPLRLLAASNPGSAGHTWVKRRYVGDVDMSTGVFMPPIRPFIPSLIDDNPSLDRDSYKRTLSHIHPTIRDQLMRGDWDAREPGDYFRLEWFGPLLEYTPDPSQCRRVRWWDLAASEREEAARTAGVLMGRHVRGARFIEHATAFKATPGKRDAKIVQQAQIDGHGVVVGLEIEGGSGGPAQFEALSKTLRSKGFRVAGAKPKAELTDHEGRTMMRNPVSDGAKALRAAPVAACLERGYQKRGECPDTGEHDWWGEFEGKDFEEQTDGIRLVAGPWVQGYIDEVSGFPDLDLKDLVDGTVGAWAYLEAHPFGSSVPPSVEAARMAAELQNVHPEDRPDPAKQNGHSRPPVIVPRRKKLWTP